jgi:hypothetical protein
MQRTFRYIAIVSTGVAQPLIYTPLTAAVTGPLEKYSGGSQLVSIPVTSSAIFVAKDYVTLMSLTGTNKERLMIESIPDSTHILVRGMTIARLATDLAVLSSTNVITTVQALDGNAAALGIANGPSGSLTTGAGLVFKMVQTASGTQPQYFSSALLGLGNAEFMDDFWMVGTAGDKYLPSVVVL